MSETVGLEVVSCEGFDLTMSALCCKQFCGWQSLKEPQSSAALKRAAWNRFNMNHLRPIEFQEFQQDLECGSGPGGWRSPRP